MGQSYSEPVERLLEELTRLPGIGPRSAERLAYHILRQAPEEAMGLALAIRDVKKLIKPPAGEAYVRTENPKGEVGYYVVSDGSKIPWRVRIRAPSLNNLSITDKIVPGWMLADVVAWIGSLDIVLGDVDR